MKGKALVDMDLIVYRIGFACDGHFYEYMGERYTDKRALDSMLKGYGIDDSSSVVTEGNEPEPWGEVKKSIISFTEGILDDYLDYRGFISGKSNFRYKVATIRPYKGDRSGAKPFHYDAIRQFLVDVYRAEIAENKEADDCIGLACEEGDVVISIDKDLDMIPGQHYNWERDVLYTVDDLTGYKNFFKQVLTGDSTDNILGLYGVGPKSQLLKSIDSMSTVEEMVAHVTKEYESRFGSYAPAFLEENAKLLWILQNRENPLVQGKYWES